MIFNKVTRLQPIRENSIRPHQTKTKNKLNSSQNFSQVHRNGQLNKLLNKNLIKIKHKTDTK